MLDILRGFFGRIESDETPLIYWLFGLLAIILVRNLMEGFLEANHHLLPAHYLFVDFAAAYALLFLALLLILKAVTGGRSESIAKVLVVLFTLILIVPVIDCIASSGQGYEIGYLNGDFEYLSSMLLSYYGDGSATIGEKIEGLVFGSLLLIYIYIKTGSRIRSVAGLGLSYVALFTWSAIPSLIYAVSNVFFASPLAGGEVIARGAFDKGFLIRYITPEVSLAVISILVAAAVSVVIFLERKRLRLPTSLFRPLRTAHYALLAAFGSLLGYSVAGPLEHPLYNYLFSFSFAVSIILLYQFASLLNDVFDRDAHERPGGKGNCLAAGTGLHLAFSFLAMSLLVGYSVGYAACAMLAIIAALAYLYSAPPFRLKRYPLLAPLALAGCALATVMGGFAVFAGEEGLGALPPEMAALLLVVYTLGVNYKDLKDYETDRERGVYTIPVVLGPDKGRTVISLLTAASFLLVPAITGLSGLWLPSIAVAAASLFLIYRDSNEFYFRIMHLAYFAIAAAAIAGAY